MSDVKRRFFGLAEEHKASLVLVAVVLALGSLMQSPPHSEAEAKTALHRVYSMEAQPVVCLPERTGPTR